NAGSLTLHAVVDGVTIAGSGNPARGIRVQANDGGETADATISNTVIAGLPTPLEVRADNGRTAKAETTFSNYDISDVVANANLDGPGASGLAEAKQVGVANFEPRFADAAAGDFPLLRSPQLIDAGTPVAPPVERLDLDGPPRAASPDCPLTAGTR